MFEPNVVQTNTMEKRVGVTGHILIVEDESKLLSHLAEIFDEEQFVISTCGSLPELLQLMSSDVSQFDVIILDRLLHGQDSAQVIQQLRDKFPHAGVLILSAINTAAEKAALLDKGADDYVSKPFSAEELVARVRVLLRRGQKHLEMGNMILDSEDRMVQVGDRETPLTNKEFTLLKTFMSNPGKIFSKSYLYEKVWDMSADVDSNVVEATVNKLRRRLKEIGATPQIKNMRNSGYWIEV